jgi:hypothetical protein
MIDLKQYRKIKSISSSESKQTNLLLIISILILMNVFMLKIIYDNTRASKMFYLLSLFILYRRLKIIFMNITKAFYPISVNIQFIL